MGVGTRFVSHSMLGHAGELVARAPRRAARDDALFPVYESAVSVCP